MCTSTAHAGREVRGDRTYALAPLPGTHYLVWHWRLTTDYWLLTTDYWLLTTYYLLLITYYLLPTTDYLLLRSYVCFGSASRCALTYYSLPTAYYQVCSDLLLTTQYLLPGVLWRLWGGETAPLPVRVLPLPEGGLPLLQVASNKQQVVSSK